MLTYGSHIVSFRECSHAADAPFNRPRRVRGETFERGAAATSGERTTTGSASGGTSNRQGDPECESLPDDTSFMA